MALSNCRLRLLQNHNASGVEILVRARLKRLAESVTTELPDSTSILAKYNSWRLARYVSDASILHFFPQVYNMFRHGQDKIQRVDTAGKSQSASRSSYSLSCSALRRGLSSLGVPLGNEDFDALMATVDPMRRGEVSYADFCKTMNLHQVRGDCLRAAATGRETSLRPSISSMSVGQGVVNGGKSSIVNTGGRGRPVETEGGGSARRRAMMFTPPDAMNLDGGIFHRNPATDGCTVPTYTTTMMTNASRGNTNNSSCSRQSPMAPRSSPHIFSSGGDLIKDDVANIISGRRSPHRWSETAEAAESKFRRCLGRYAGSGRMVVVINQYLWKYMSTHALNQWPSCSFFLAISWRMKY